MSELPIKITWNDIKNNPTIWGYFVIVSLLVSLVWFFVTSNSKTTIKAANDCSATIADLRNENKQLRNDKDQLINVLLVKNGIIGKLTTITDSMSDNKKDENKPHN